MRQNLDMKTVISQKEMKENFDNIPKINVTIPTFRPQVEKKNNLDDVSLLKPTLFEDFSKKLNHEDVKGDNTEGQANAR